MKHCHLKNNITYFFLAIFILLKTVGLHELSHSNDKEHAEDCIICDYAIAHNLTPTIPPTPQDPSIESIKLVVVAKEKIRFCSFLDKSILAKSELFSRPPPNLS